MDDEWTNGDGRVVCDADGYAYGGDEYFEEGDEGEDEAEEEEPEWDLEQAKEESKGCRELFGHLRRTLGRNHAHTRRAHGNLLQAEQRERDLKGPKSYWQEGRKRAKRKVVLLRLVDKWSADYDEKEEQFQEAAYRHQEDQQGTLDKISEAREELREIQKKDEAYARLQEGGDAYDDDKDDVPQDVLRETANQVAVIIEAAGMGQIEQVTEQLNLLSAQLGGTLQRLPRRGDEQQGNEARKGNASGRGAGPCPEGNHQGETPSSGRWKSKGKGKSSKEELGGSEASGARDEENDRREAKLAARARGEGSRARMETDSGTTGPGTEAAGGAAAEETAMQQAPVDAIKWQRALDTIRGRLQLAKNHKLAERQRQLIEEGLLPEPHEWTEEQLRQNQRQVEVSNAEVDAEAERELSAMSHEARTQLLEAAAR